MKKGLLFALALLLAMVFSTGTVLASSDKGNAWGQSNKEKKHVQEQVKKSVQEQVKKSVQEAFEFYQKEKPSQKKIQFSDIQQHWATRSIQDMAAVGIFKGYPDGTFKPNQELTQAEALSLVMRIYNDEDPTPIDNDATLDEDEDLADVPEWVRDNAGKANKKGIIKLNRFHSGVQASRAQTAVMIAKALELEPVDTSDMPFKDGLLISKEDVGYILALYEEGILSGDPNGNFNPNSSITRAEMATMLERLLNKSEIVSVTLPATATVVQGESITLTAVVKYADGTTNANVSWESSDTTLATVEDGVVTAAAGKTGTVTITATATRDDASKSDTCVVTIVEEQQITTGTLEATDNVGAHDGIVYEEYRLEVNGLPISLAQDKVKSITLQKEGSSVLTLTPNTDSTLWFNVQRSTGEYTLRVIDNDDVSYEATLDWTAPIVADAVATGDSRVQNGNTYVEYELGDLDLTEFDRMQQIKPDGSVVGLTVSSDANLWLQTNLQITGEHTFLIQQDDVWYISKITI